ncbi:MAG TPA: YbaB/EbfC family nucleoid-associated protein [Amycolatopsis sp.]|jgi:DNA-binding protein YbaB|nr:YbaB/EbfC family nucleoid-associated protein [Amycolatopsis sp.]
MSGPMPGGGEDALAGLDRWVAQARAKAERYQAMRSAAGEVSVTESSKDDLVTVTVDSAGNVTDLRITDRVRELTGAQVAAAVLGTLRKAQSRLPERLGEVMAETIGDDRQTVETIVGNYRAKFPEPEPEETEPPATEPLAAERGTTGEQRIGVLEDDPATPATPVPPAPEVRNVPIAPPRERPAPPPPKRRRSDGEDEDDEGFDGGSIMVRG